MKYVYILSSCWSPDEGTEILGAFTSLEGAKAHVKSNVGIKTFNSGHEEDEWNFVFDNNSIDDCYQYRIEKVEVWE